jgi:hypothetical protein
MKYASADAHIQHCNNTIWHMRIYDLSNWTSITAILSPQYSWMKHVTQCY